MIAEACTVRSFLCHGPTLLIRRAPQYLCQRLLQVRVVDRLDFVSNVRVELVASAVIFLHDA